eukprot:317175-Chlamydomonas_euryale.AAC.2
MSGMQHGQFDAQSSARRAVQHNFKQSCRAWIQAELLGIDSSRAAGHGFKPSCCAWMHAYCRSVCIHKRMHT